jgi:inner membrane protein YidH
MTQSERRSFDESVDAIRRTRLANERTYLAWWRTGLTSLAVALAAGKVVPDLTNTRSTWPYEAIGAGFALLGVACIAYGLRRERQVERALMQGEFVPPDPALAFGLTAAGVLLGMAVFALLATGR